MKDTWFSSDSHFFHNHIQKFCPNTRPQGSVEEMNEMLIEAWNSRVKPSDTVWYLGDFSFGKAHQTMEVLDRFNGRINLVLGNHDQVIRRDKNLQRYFETIQDYAEIKFNSRFIVMCHFPFETWNKKRYGSYHLHGHVHGGTSHDPLKAVEKRFDVGVDNRLEKDLAPFHWDEIYERVKNES